MTTQPPPSDEQLHQFEVEAAAASNRLDVFATARLPGLSRTRVQRLIEAGLVNVDGRLVRASYQVRPGETVEVLVPPAEPTDLVAEPIPLKVVFEDDHLIVVDKPPGLVVHPAPGHYRGTLVHALLWHCQDLAGVGGELRPGIVHRLDRDTSGVLVATKTDEAHHGLVDQFKSRRIKKVYLALVWGRPPRTGEIDRPIGRHPTRRHKMAADVPGGRPALTRWRRLTPYRAGVSLLEVDILTGRTHQIRVHLSHAGFPVVGDQVYGPRQDRRLQNVAEPDRAILDQVERQMLHAHSLTLEHPVTGARLTFRAEPAPDMALVLADLERKSDEKA